MRRAIALVTALLFFGPLSPVAATARDFPAGYTAHHTFAEVRAELRELAAEHPDIVRLSSFGKSYEGRRLWLVKISDNVGTDEIEPEVYVDGGAHGHEHLSTEVALRLIHWLVDGYADRARPTAIVNSTEIWVAPMVNPDGATHDISEGEFHRWRKNRQPNADSAAMGVDPNRNFGYKWGCCPGSSGDPSSAFYRGAEPWTTRESRAARRFVASRVVGGRQQLRLALTIHSHGEFVMYPFGWTRDESHPDMRSTDLSALRRLAEGMASRNGYRAVHAGTLYLSNGTFMDWAYARERILALTLELGPGPGVADGWYVPDDQLEHEIGRNRDALLWFLEQAQSR